ncbi:hypothetical protein [Phaeobacter sp. J2-8]|uniref:hypothetical protein n=1 Tax=Phaeobacter sp. J2-8 TaxID=2931394 RepID=UPI001FD2AA01|nr:hypothetical protein [Phaeobacter sp. J2-8]MCJ7874835.1 hypothetical protein [Phaeobacter sp. J2-8]
MALTPAEVESAYRVILERIPSPDEITNASNRHDKLATLRQTLLNSEEFYRKFDKIRSDFNARLKPVLVHICIPEAVDPGLFEVLATATDLQPATVVDDESFAALCAKPRPERLKLRYVYGDLAGDVGPSLGVPYLRLCTIRRPGDRLYRLYQQACRSENDNKTSFGTYLKYSLESEAHRLELDNGQIRRLAGQRTLDSLGQEQEVLTCALHTALAPDMIFGFAENSAALLDRLAKKDLDLAPGSMSQAPDVSKDYKAAVAKLDKNERAIFDTYTAWDNYLYDVCEALLSPVIA